MADLTSLTHEVTQIVLNCPAPAAGQALLSAAREFCEHTRLWEQTLSAVPVVASVADYTLAPPSGGEPFSLRQVYLLNAQNQRTAVLTLLSDDDLAALDPSATSGQPQACALTSAGLLHVWPTPDSGSSGTSISARVALRPTLTATSLPVLLDQFRREIMAGAAARLFASSAMPWADLKQAGMFRQAFDDGLSRGASHFYGPAARARPRRLG